MKELILQRLERIERERQVRILYAVESGSRCWGFASPNSDWDVRFIYIHPLPWYLGIGDKRDVIEELGPDNIDLAGWELRKALRLFRTSNPSMLEWLHSPIVYREQSSLISELRTLHAAHPDQRSQMYHYLSLARGNYEKYINHRRQVNLKRYFYVLRALMAAAMVERNGRLQSPHFMDHMCAILPSGPVRQAVEDLLKLKRTGAELGLADRISVVDDWVDERFDNHAANMPLVPASERVSTEVLDKLFMREVLHGEIVRA